MLLDEILSAENAAENKHLRVYIMVMKHTLIAPTTL